MAELNDVITFNKSGLNSDDDLKFMPMGDTPVVFGEEASRLNFYVEDGNKGVLTNAQGNELKTYSLPAIGYWKTIGWVYDRENKALIYFLWNSQDNHSILRYYLDTDSFERILWREISLNFRENYKIYNPRIIGDGDRQLLIWTDGFFNSYGDYNEVRKVNITKASNKSGNEYQWTNCATISGTINTIDTYFRLKYIEASSGNIINADEFIIIGTQTPDKVYYSYDGGDTFGNIAAPADVEQVQILRYNYYFYLTEFFNSRLYRVTGTSHTQTLVLDGAAVNHWYMGLSVVNEDDMFVCGRDNGGATSLIRRSINGGAAWANTVIGAVDFVLDIFAVTQNYAWAICTNNANNTYWIYATTNGVAWNLQYTTAEQLGELFFLDSQIGWCVVRVAVGGPLRILRTTNGGGTWTSIATVNMDSTLGGGTTQHKFISFVNSQEGFIIGERGADTVSAVTRDGGFTWLVETVDTGTFGNIAAFTNQSGNLFSWAVQGSDVYRYEKIGADWENMYRGLNNGNMNLLKPPPLRPAIFNFYNQRDSNPINPGTGVTNFNFIRGKVFQFSYNYIYDDNEESTYAPYSEVSIPSEIFNAVDNEEFVNGILVYATYLNNYIAIKVDVDYVNIQNVNLAYRIKDVGSGVEGNWVLYDKLDITDTDRERRFKVIEFHGDLIPSLLATSDFNRLYDDVPLTADHMEAINDNRIILGGNRKNYSSTEIDVSLDVVIRTINDAAISTHKEIILTGNNADFTISANNYQVVILLNQSSGQFEVYPSYDDDVDYFVAQINEKTALSVVASNVAGSLRIANNSGTYSVVADVRNYLAIDKYKTWKSGSYKNLGIIYYDYAGRSSQVNKTEDSRILVPFLPDNNLYNRFNSLNGIKFTINHLAPAWATHYQWVYASQDVERFFWIPIKVQKNYFEGTDVEKQTNYVIINLPQATNRVNNSFYGYDLRDFSVQAGDLLRFVGWVDTPTIAINDVTDFDTIRLDGDGYEFKIQAVLNDGRIVINSWDSLPFAIYLNGDDDSSGSGSGYPSDLCEFVIAEIFRKGDETDDDDLIYKEVGQVYPIKDRYHQVQLENDFSEDLQHQNDLRPAIGIIDSGDAYVYGRQYFDIVSRLSNFYDPTIFDTGAMYCFIETENISEVYNSRSIDEGRINVYNPVIRFDKYNILQYGGQYIDNTSINDLNEFEFSNFANMDDKHGRIGAVRQLGYELVVIQERKLTVIDVERTTFTNPDGTTQVVAITGVLGSKRPSIEEYGTVNPGSVEVNKRDIYFFDVNEGKMLRKSPNGIFPISDYKMEKWFRDKSKNMIERELEDYDVYSKFDEDNGLLYVSFVRAPYESGSGSAISFDEGVETLAFSEESLRWVSFFSFAPDILASLGGLQFVSFKDGQLYLHNSDNVNRCTFYGVRFDPNIKFVSNRDNHLIRLYNAMEIASSNVEGWSASQTGDIEVPSNNMYPNDQISRLREAQFRIIEGKGYGAFLRDMRTTNAVANVGDLLNGRYLRGYEMIINLRNTENGEVNLYYVTVKSSVSR